MIIIIRLTDVIDFVSNIISPSQAGALSSSL